MTALKNDTGQGFNIGFLKFRAITEAIWLRRKVGLVGHRLTVACGRTAFGSGARWATVGMRVLQLCKAAAGECAQQDAMGPWQVGEKKKALFLPLPQLAALGSMGERVHTAPCVRLQQREGGYAHRAQASSGRGVGVCAPCVGLSQLTLGIA